MSGKDDVISSLSALSVECWRLAMSFEKAISDLPEGKAQRYASQLRFSRMQLETIVAAHGLRLVTFDGEAFHDGLPTSADNLADFDEGCELVVQKTLEPTIIKDMNVVSKGRVLVAEKGME